MHHSYYFWLCAFFERLFSLFSLSYWSIINFIIWTLTFTTIVFLFHVFCVLGIINHVMKILNCHHFIPIFVHSCFVASRKSKGIICRKGIRFSNFSSFYFKNYWMSWIININIWSIINSWIPILWNIWRLLFQYPIVSEFITNSGQFIISESSTNFDKRKENTICRLIFINLVC